VEFIIGPSERAYERPDEAILHVSLASVDQFVGFRPKII
jgi:hypothetical protein